MSPPILSLRIQYEQDVVACRQRARQIAEALGFDVQQQTKLATAVSEIARNAYMYGGGGKAEFFLEGVSAPQLLSIHITDKGSGISNLDQILEEPPRVDTVVGLGIRGARRLMDRFSVDTAPGKGTRVVLGKVLPRGPAAITQRMVPELIARIERHASRDILDEFRHQNVELMGMLDELRKRQEELLNLNRELEDTNRGVVALYAELDEKADHLRRADEVKSRFLSNMSHEFRTPLNSILALARLLGGHTDGDLTAEQEIQVTYIRKSAESLSELVNDLLDLAKVKAGKIVIRPVEFEVSKLFGTLRGMLRPLLVTSSVDLVFEEAGSCPAVYSDEGKISQILRNFISNALKFTEAGEVRVWVECPNDETFITFRVSDTGIGIAPDDKETIFQEFAQLDNPIQHKVRGTGLGLPLSRKLAELLGGSVQVESDLGAGSVFSVRIPRIYQAAGDTAPFPEAVSQEFSGTPVLLVEDHVETRLLYSHYLRGSPWQIISARSTREAGNVLRKVKPAAILLDILLEGEETWDFLARLKLDPATSSIPVLVATHVEDYARAMALGADAFAQKPLEREALLQTLRDLTGQRPQRTVLLIDDEEVSRYLYKQIFRDIKVRFVEASNGAEGIGMARLNKPDLVIIDLNMPVMDGFEAIGQMQADSLLKQIPVIVFTSKRPADDRIREIAKTVLAIIPKDGLSEDGIRDRMDSILRSAGLEDLIAGAERGSKAMDR
jgi:signal transduction histidine kinase/CheY-like chemotaxis protein